MKKLLTLCIAFIAFTFCSAQDWDWAVTTNSTGKDVIWDIAHSPDGNIISVGRFTDQLETPNHHQYTSNGEADVFVASYKPNGQINWTTTFGGKMDDIGIDVDCDSQGNVFVAGYFSDTLNILGQQFTGQGWEIFLVKLDPAGQILWIQHPESDGSELGHGLTVDANDNVILTGWFQNSITFKNGSNLKCKGSSDILIAKYNNDGEFLYADNPGGPGVDYAFKAAADAHGNYYIGGIATPGATIGNHNFDQYACYVAKYDQNNNFTDIGTIAGPVGTYGFNCDKEGNVYFCGHYSDTAYFGNDIAIEEQNQSTNGFIAKFNTQGHWEWVYRLGGDGSSKIRMAATDEYNNIYFTGSFNGTLQVETEDYTAQQDDIYAGKLTPGGELQWFKTVGGEFGEKAFGIAAANGYVYVSGWFAGNVQFGENQINSTGEADDNLFLACLSHAVGTEETLPQEYDLTLYPNPVKNQLHIQIPASNDNWTLEIYNLSGQRIYTKQSIQNPIINASAFPPGFYTTSLTNGQQNLRGKFIKE